MTLDVNPEELAILTELIEARLRELGPEIHHTQSSEYRERLKELRRRLAALLERLTAAAA